MVLVTEKQHMRGPRVKLTLDFHLRVLKLPQSQNRLRGRCQFSIYAYFFEIFYWTAVLQIGCQIVQIWQPTK